MTTTLCRKFLWSDYNLWPEHLPKHTLVLLGGNDRLLEAGDTFNWLKAETNARVMYDPEMRHGEMLRRPEYQTVVVDQWSRMAADCEAELCIQAARPAASAAAAPVKASTAAKAVAPKAPAPRLLIEAVAEGEEEEEEEDSTPVASSSGRGSYLAAPVLPRSNSLPKQQQQQQQQQQRAVPAQARTSPFASALHAATAAGISSAAPALLPPRHPLTASATSTAAARAATAAPAAAAPAARTPITTRASVSEAEIQKLLKELRMQQERVRVQEEANRAAAQQLIAIAGAVARGQVALSGGTEGSASDPDSGVSDLSSGSIGLGDDASSIDSESIDRAIRASSRSTMATAVQHPRVSGNGDAAFISGRELRSPFLAYAASVGGAGQHVCSATSMGGRYGATAALHRAAHRQSHGGGAAAAAAAMRKGAGVSLGDSMSIDLGALAYGGGLLCGGAGVEQRRAAALAGMALAEAQLSLSLQRGVAAADEGW